MNEPSVPARRKPSSGLSEQVGSPIVGLAHIGVTVSDLDRSLDFYVNGLGLECSVRRRVDQEYIRRIVNVHGTEAIELAMLTVPGSDVAIELLQYIGCERHPASARPCDPGTGHFSLAVNDIRLAWEKARSLGVTTRSPEPVAIDSGPYQGGRSGYLLDPDGYCIELLELPTQTRGQRGAAPETARVEGSDREGVMK